MDRRKVDGPADDGVGAAVAGIPALDRTDLSRKLVLERHHWWYRGRRAVLRGALERIGLRSASEVLDAGCGTGHNSALLAQFGPVVGADLNREAVQVAQDRGVDAHWAPLEQLPFASSRFELVVCLDVLEHLQEDLVVLRELHRVLRSGGTLVVTVPAYPWLASEHDQAAGHVRRYTRRSLLERTDAVGLRPALLTHFNFFLLPLAVLARRGRRRHSETPRSDLLRTPEAVDGVLSWPMRAEARLIRAGLELPAGLSILAALVKP